MKRLLLILCFILSVAGYSQIVNIPDANFKSKLLSAAVSNGVAKDSGGNPMVIDANGDNEIEQSEALAVYQLDVHYSNISVLTGIEAFQNLENLNCGANTISSLDISTLVNLQFLDCSDNMLQNLDAGSNINLTTLIFYGNQLITLYIKNGQDETITSDNWTENPYLEYICADESQLDAITAQVNSNVVVNSYCSLTPGGNYNTVTGGVRYDIDNNGNCDSTDPLKSFVKIKVEGPNPQTVFTDFNGNYTFYGPAGNYTLTPDLEDAAYFTISPSSANAYFPDDNNNTDTENFCLSDNGSHTDIEVVMEPIGAAVPGEDATYKIVYKNKGNQVLSGSISCEWSYSIFDVVDVTPLPDNVDIDTYTWNFSNLQPLENREITMVLNVNSETESPPINPGALLPFTANAVITGDEAPDDNTFDLNQYAAPAQVPNSLTCIEGDNAPAEGIGDYLHYVINFTNTGTSTVDSVVIEQQIDPSQFDISTLQVLNSSLNVSTQVMGNTIKFIFNNANMAVDDHGNILFKLKSKPGLMEGQTVQNRATIYYGYDNPPMETNTAETTYGVLSSGDFAKDTSIKVYPNPVKDIVQINAASAIQSVQVYDVQGRLLQSVIENADNITIDLTVAPAGIYFLKITTAQGAKVEKLIKQ